jgi:hypothetical protein
VIVIPKRVAPVWWVFLDLGALLTPSYFVALEHDPEKWIPVFRKDHASPKIQSAMPIQPQMIAH